MCPHRITEEPVLFSRMNDLSSAHDSLETDLCGEGIFEMSERVNEIGLRMGSIASEEENELTVKFCELKEAMTLSLEDFDRIPKTAVEGQPNGGAALENGFIKDGAVDLATSGRCRGAKKRKSGSVKRFKQDPAAYPLKDLQNEVPCNAIEPLVVQHPDCTGNYTICHNEYADPKTLGAITQILRPISYRASISNNNREILVAFEALRSDGSVVTVDNKFLKANNPLLLIEFYEKHLRYSAA